MGGDDQHTEDVWAYTCFRVEVLIRMGHLERGSFRVGRDVLIRGMGLYRSCWEPEYPEMKAAIDITRIIYGTCNAHDRRLTQPEMDTIELYVDGLTEQDFPYGGSHATTETLQ